MLQISHFYAICVIFRGNRQLVYDTGKGFITEKKIEGTGFKNLSSQSNEKWICKEGCRISVQLKFVEVGLFI